MPHAMATWHITQRSAALVIDNAILRERIQPELDKLGLTGDLADQLVRELNFLACLLIDVVTEAKQNGKSN